MQSFPAFELTLVVALILIGWAGLKLYELGPEVTETHDSLVELRDRYFLLSDVIQTNITELDEALTQFLEGKDQKGLVGQRRSRIESHQRFAAQPSRFALLARQSSGGLHQLY
jgi:hypothetical protein